MINFCSTNKPLKQQQMSPSPLLFKVVVALNG